VTFPSRTLVLSALVVAALALIVTISLRHRQRPGIPNAGPVTLAERLTQIGPAARHRLQSPFQAAGVKYPPAAATLVAYKHEARLVLYATGPGIDPTLIATYPILGTSGHLGPKLREGDRQIPEGFYRLQALNPNSSYHVSIRINYPNAFDLAQASRDDRATPGTDIFIHGSDRSIGCLALGDPAAEELFVLAHDVGLANTELLIAPFDPRRTEPPPPIDAPAWMAPLYDQLADRIRALPAQ
jgi:hypothetical protein